MTRARCRTEACFEPATGFYPLCEEHLRSWMDSDQEEPEPVFERTYEFEATCMPCSFHTYFRTTREQVVNWQKVGLRCEKCRGRVLLEELPATIRSVA